jgi:hypothetical protein
MRRWHDRRLVRLKRRPETLESGVVFVTTTGRLTGAPAAAAPSARAMFVAARTGQGSSPAPG